MSSASVGSALTAGTVTVVTPCSLKFGHSAKNPVGTSPRCGGSRIHRRWATATDGYPFLPYSNRLIAGRQHHLSTGRLNLRVNAYSVAGAIFRENWAFRLRLPATSDRGSAKNGHIGVVQRAEAGICVCSGLNVPRHRCRHNPSSSPKSCGMTLCRRGLPAYRRSRFYRLMLVS